VPEAMPSASTLWVFSLATLVLVAMPGPGVLYLVGRTLDQGRRAGVASMLGIESGELVHVVAAAVGLSALLAASATALDVVRYAGAAYLIVLGIRRWRAGAEPQAPVAPQRASARRIFAQGLVVQVLNPKVAIFFLAYLPQFLDPSAPVAPQVLLLGVVYLAIAMASDGVYVILASLAARRLRNSEAAQRRMARASAATYVGLGMFAALSGRSAS
jgi:threonine/homoserine/homoserine lactone efflux protein